MAPGQQWCSASIGQSQLPPHLPSPHGTNIGHPNKPYFYSGRELRPRGPCMGSWRPSTAASRPCCGTQCSRRCGSSWGRSTSRSRSGRRPCGATRPRPRYQRDYGNYSEISARIGRLQQAQLWNFHSGSSHHRSKALPPLQQVWNLLHHEKRNFSASPQLKRLAPPMEPPVVQPIPPAPRPPHPGHSEELPSPMKRRRSASPEQSGNGAGQHPPGAPHFQLPKAGLWNPLHGDTWGPERKNVVAPERQEPRNSVAHPFPYPSPAYGSHPPPHRLPPAPAPPERAMAARPAPLEVTLKPAEFPGGGRTPAPHQPASPACLTPRGPPRPAPPPARPRGGSRAPAWLLTVTKPGTGTVQPGPGERGAPAPRPRPPPLLQPALRSPAPLLRQPGPPEPGPPPPLPWLKGPGVRDQGEGAAGGDPLDEILFGCGGEPQLGPCDSAGTRGGFQDSTTSSQGSRGAGAPRGEGEPSPPPPPTPSPPPPTYRCAFAKQEPPGLPEFWLETPPREARPPEGGEGVPKASPSPPNTSGNFRPQPSPPPPPPRASYPKTLPPEPGPPRKPPPGRPGASSTSPGPPWRTSLRSPPNSPRSCPTGWPTS
ncbi:unnamed protein product [Lepidochelys olivacea]